MVAAVIEIRKRKYVCGLFWQSLSQPRQLRSEAVELARKMNFDLLVLRKDLGLAQAGFASTREGAHKGMLSLGAMVASTVAVKGVHHDGRQQAAASWLAAFRLDESRWAYFAVRDESFLPAGDFAGSRAEVLERLYADYGLGGWNAVIGEPELADQGFHDFVPATIDEFLPPSSSRRLWLASAWELAPVERPRVQVLVAGGVAAVVAVGGAGLAWQRHREAEAALERERALQTAQQQLTAEQAVQAPPPPWVGKATPRELARACAGRMDRWAPGGWQLDEYACSPAGVTYTWSRGNSNIAYLREHVPAAMVDLTGDKARHAEPVSLPPGPGESLLPAEQLLMALMSRFQHLGVRLAIQAPPAPAPVSTLPGVRQIAPAAPPWKEYGFSFQADGLPLADLASALSQPGVRVKTMTYRGSEWIVEGVAYAK